MLSNGERFEHSATRKPLKRARCRSAAKALLAMTRRATRDVKLSKPDYDVWVLACKNATYRIGRYPDMAAKVEKLK
jgi:hypothetical protein